MPQAMALPTVLVLAAGAGRRFRASGGSGSKLTAELDGRPLIEHTLDAVRASGLPWHVERGAHPGMGDSIAAAVRATALAPGGWLVLPADLPLIQATTLRRVAGAGGLGQIAVPHYQGQRGHPVYFPPGAGPRLMQLRGPAGAAALLRTEAVLALEVDDPGCVMDVDTVEDLARAAAWRAAGRGGPVVRAAGRRRG